MLSGDHHSDRKVFRHYYFFNIIFQGYVKRQRNSSFEFFCLSDMLNICIKGYFVTGGEEIIYSQIVNILSSVGPGKNC